MITNRSKMVVGLISLLLLLGATACSPQNEGLIVSPTVFVTVFVTPITATPAPVTPQPVPTNEQPPQPTYFNPDAPWNAPIYFPGPGCSGSRLHKEDRAFVAATGQFARVYKSKNVPLDPGVRDLIPGEEMTILAGPFCEEEWVFWNVIMDSDELEGWVPEGNGDVYYLLPAGPAVED